MAEVLVSAVVGVLLEKLLAGELINFARSEEISSKLNKWEKTLRQIKALLADAAQKQIEDEGVKMWLVELQDLAYDIDDVLDGMATEIMKREFEESEASSSSSSSKLLKMLPACFTNCTPHNIMYGRNISSNLDEITTRLNGLFERTKILGLEKILGLKPNVTVERSNKTDVRYLETSLLPDASKILGREGDKEALLGKLLGDEGACSYQNVSIVSIVGMGGIGKTTLARLLYNDEKVKDHFEVKAWVCVSDDFDVFNISKQIYQAVGGEERPFASLNLLHEALQIELSNKRFLLVLDDVWNEQHDTWEALKGPLVGAPGSKILVTTRNTKVSSVMNSVQHHNLGVLSEELALSLFARCALDEENFEEHQQLKPIAQGIVEKCKGLPVALIALGRVLKKKGNEKWEELLNSEVWSLKDENDILPALKLSYYDLPPHLKQLFAYCSFFPKDYEFKMNELVLLWMAEGFLSGSKSMESLGREYFQELQSRSFFQQIGNDETKYTMHDLMHDLAISVAGEFFFRLDENMDLNGRSKGYGKFRHFSFIGQPDAVFRNLDRARCLRTFLPVSVGWKRSNALKNVPVQLLPQLQFLRVLSLSSWSIREVPESIDKLKHLRYLNFSSSSIKVLPEQVSELYNLQTLLVRKCHELSSLPVSFVKLINLRHLDMTDTPSLKKTPVGIGGLTSLQTLSKVVIQEDNGFKISELKGLKDLQGGLSIEGLEKVIDPTEAKDANLQQKKGLDDLELLWGSSPLFGDSHDPSTKDEVLERLRPHHKLKNLKIIGYGGEKFPSWIGDPSSSSSLKTLLIKDCKNLKSVPHGHFQSLTSLEELEIYGCPSMEYSFGCGLWPPNLRRLIIGESDRREPTFEYNVIEGLRAPQCKLEKLKIHGYSEMKIPSWIGDPSFNQLTELRLDHCKCTELQTIGHLTSLRVVKIKSCDALESYCCPNSVERLSIKSCRSITSVTFSKLPEEVPYSLKELTLVRLQNLESIPHEHFQCLATLEELTIHNCTSLPFPSPCGSLWPPNLRKLTIGKLGRIMSDWGLQNYPPSLVELELYCKGSGVVSFGVMEQQDHNNNNTTSSACFLLPPSLTRLTIFDMEEVESVSEVLQHLPHLQRLYI